MARIFVSYRRQDSAGHAGRLYDHLRAFFGSGRVFMDVDGIDPGTDFTQVLDERIAAAEVMVAVIGPSWISITGSDGVRRIDSKDDYVFREIATALARGVEVIPVLVAGAAVPQPSELPHELADLARRQMYVVSDTAFDAGIARLIRAVERSAARTREARRLAPRPAKRLPRALARLLLLYEPARPATWLVHMLFFTLLVLALLSPPAIWFAMRDRQSALAAFGAMLLWLSLVRGIALLVEPDAAVSPLRRWLLLYNPPRITIAAVHALFIAMLITCVLTPFGFVALMREQPTDLVRLLIAEAWVFLVIVTFAIREIGAASDPLRPAPQDVTWFARLFCLWKPRRGLAWLPRMIFYAACVALALLVPQVWTGDDGNFGDVNFTRAKGTLVLSTLIAAIAVSARGAARAIEVNWPGDRSLQPLPLFRTAALLYRPWRRAGWVPIALFWIGIGCVIGIVAGGPNVLATLGLDESAGSVLSIIAGLMIVCAWTWAGMYRPPVKWNESQATVSSGV
jgi:hypothetical protein